MNNLRLSNYPKHIGIKTEVNGVELQEVCDIHLFCPVDGLPKLCVEQNVYPELDVTVNGIVEPHLRLLDDALELHVEHDSPTSTRYWATRRKEAQS